MPAINSLNVLRCLTQYYHEEYQNKKTPTHKQEEKIADRLTEVIDGILEACDVSVDSEFDLTLEDKMNQATLADIMDNLPDDDDEPVQTEPQSLSQPSQHSSYHPSQPDRPYNYVDFGTKREVIEFWRGSTKSRRTLAAVQNRYTVVTYEEQLYRWEKQIGDGGSRNDKLFSISKLTLADFKRAKRDRLPVHDFDIRRFGLKANKTAGMEGFKASPSWVQSFKTVNRIVSRNITKFVTLKSTALNDQLALSSREFVGTIKLLIFEHDAALIRNTDQSGFNREMHSGRSLDYKGVQHVEAKMQSSSAMTHSYTIRPIFSAAGVLSPKMLLVIQENTIIKKKNDMTPHFGPIIPKNLFKASNLVVLPSKSGKLDKNLFEIFYRQVFFPSAELTSILLVDSWSAHADMALVTKAKPVDVEVDLKIIPPGTTGKIQPWDVYGFRLWKQFARFFSERVLIDGLDIVLHERNSIIKLQSLIHNQFSSPRFRECFKYGWYKAGYIEVHPAPFVTPVEFCFRGAAAISQEERNSCKDLHFITYAFCQKVLCFDHFFTFYHFCGAYEP